jgi:hypothetical protein
MNNVYLFQPNYKGGMGQFTSHWLPYSIATIWAYVEQFDFVKDNFEVQKTFLIEHRLKMLWIKLPILKFVCLAHISGMKIITLQ